MRAPGVDLRRLKLRTARRAGLIEQHDDWLAHPAEDFHLRADVAGCLGRFGGVDEVEHHIGLLAHVFERLLAAPERTVGDAVPGLREEPQHRIALALQTLHQPGAVAKSWCVPQAQHEAAGFEQQVRFIEERHMRRVTHLAHVLAQQRAGQRGLARVRVGDEAQRDDVRGIAHARLSALRWRRVRGFESGEQGGH